MQGARNENHPSTFQHLAREGGDESFVDRCDVPQVVERNATNGYPPAPPSTPLSSSLACPLCARYSAVTESLINIRIVGWPV